MPMKKYKPEQIVMEKLRLELAEMKSLEGSKFDHKFFVQNRLLAIVDARCKALLVERCSMPLTNCTPRTVRDLYESLTELSQA